MARWTRSRSSSETSGNSLTTFETVRGDTPARRATSPWGTGNFSPPASSTGPYQAIASKDATWHATWQAAEIQTARNQSEGLSPKRVEPEGGQFRVAVIKLDLDRVLGPVDR